MVFLNSLQSSGFINNQLKGGRKNMDLIVAFLTGLTTGGLSCLAVQGGLLASSLANQIEQDLQAQGRSKNPSQKFQPRIAQPILLFLIAKVAAYTIFGLLLGALGSVLQLTPLMRAVLMIAIGVFMLGNGLRMLNVHPIFRYFVIEPPSVLTRYIRRTSKKSASLVTPLFLGAMTVLIPCGVTQAMMAVALGTGDPLQGMALMFAFTLGTTPVFFSVAYFATRLGATMEKYFTRIVAVAVILLGIISVDSGLNLAGSPVSFSGLLNGLTAVEPQPASPQTAATSPSVRGAPGLSYVVNVKNDGYSPKVLHLAANQPVNLNWVSKNVQSCALSVVVPGLNYQKLLPSTGQIALSIPAQPKGTVMRYACSMGMYTGQLIFDQ
jgi:sulfite exporter TauE/SafE